MELAKLLQYQKLDMEIYKIENAFRKSPEVTAVISLQNKYKEEEITLKKLVQEAQDILANFSKYSERLDVISTEEADLDKVADFSSLDDVAGYEKELASFNDNLNNLERETSRIIRRMNELKNEVQKCQNLRASLSNKYRQAKGQHEAKQKEMQQKAIPTLKALKEIKDSGAIDDVLMKKYLDLRKARKMPAFVIYNSGNCGGCGMDIAVEVEKHLKGAGSYTECPNCRRVVFKT